MRGCAGHSQTAKRPPGCRPRLGTRRLDAWVLSGNPSSFSSHSFQAVSHPPIASPSSGSICSSFPSSFLAPASADLVSRLSARQSLLAFPPSRVTEGSLSPPRRGGRAELSSLSPAASCSAPSTSSSARSLALFPRRFASLRPFGLSPLSPSQVKSRAQSLLERLQTIATGDTGAGCCAAKRGKQTEMESEKGETESGDWDTPQAVDDDLQFLLDNLSVFSPSDLLLLLAALVRWTEKVVLCSASVASGRSPAPLACAPPPTVAPLMREIVARLGTQLALLPNFPESVLLCGDLVLSSPVRDAPRFWEAFFRVFLSSAQAKPAGGVRIHGSSPVLSAPQLMHVLAFLATSRRRRRGDARREMPEMCLRTDGRKGEDGADVGARQSLGAAAEATAFEARTVADGSGDTLHDSAGSGLTASRARLPSRVTPSAEEANGEERHPETEREFAKGQEGKEVDVGREETGPGDSASLAPPSATASLAFSLWASAKAHRSTRQEEALLDRLVAAICSRLAVHTVLETLNPAAVIRLLRLLADLKAKHVPLLTEIAALLKPLCPADTGRAAAPARKTPGGTGAVASRSSLSPAEPISRTDGHPLDDEQFVARVQACGLNALFRPADLVVLFVSFAALEAHEFQSLLRGAADVLSVHVRELSLPLMVAALDSCSRLNFYPQRLAEALLRSLPPELLKVHEGQEGACGERARRGSTEERNPSEETRTDGRRTALAPRSASRISQPSRPVVSRSPAGSLPAAERRRAAEAVPVLLKALARLNVRHKTTVKAALWSLTQPCDQATSTSSPAALSSASSACASTSHARPSSLGFSDSSGGRGRTPREAPSEDGPYSEESEGSARSRAASTESAPRFVPSSAAPPQSPKDTAALVYALYRLDVWDPHAIRSSFARLERLGGAQLLALLGLKGCANVLLAASYFSCAGPTLYDEILPHMLPMEAKLTKEGVSQLKIVELACRVGHLPFSFKTLSAASRDLLLRIRSCDLEPEEVCVSGLQREVSSTARTVGYHCFTEVQVGPYTLDFVKPVTQEDLAQMAMEEEARKSIPGFRRPLRHIDDPFEHELDIKGVVLEVDGPQHFYRDSFHWTSASKLKHRLLTGLGFRIAHVPYFDWLELHTEDVRRVYLRCALERAESPLEGDDLERWASRAASRGLQDEALGRKLFSEESAVPAGLAFENERKFARNLQQTTEESRRDHVTMLMTDNGNSASTLVEGKKGVWHATGENGVNRGTLKDVGGSNATALMLDHGSKGAIEKARQITGTLSFAQAPFLSVHERRLLHEKKHGDAIKSKKIALAIYKRQRGQKRREEKEERRRKIFALQNDARNYKVGPT
ncbi:conserved hypothetical protein [Neospora caninum Liverpool]|uniref:RAP domain-containing protein n=1 Tax=Neospora caninum (strain Liverpool) TaxID=572307 RepID=F0VME9_NEOCL|nr:conserved hypothetical protein [Neospora caninum Liverpool]CBZ54895.1 conserved hypothetical protein [Neospora caninum Liverpool]CEL69616.1 TPA: RAP domain-containing protein [Neospora caninum Liverpool]|eukprot:XP_003884923.1 conserved hypothetical protein [Neospora caninum Liverpool]